MSKWFRYIVCIYLLARGIIAPIVQAQDAVPRLAVVSAFDQEMELLLDAAAVSDTLIYNGHPYYTGVLEGHEVVLFLSGVSMVNAAMYTQMALDRFQITGIVFSGIAGGVNPDLHVGDVVIPAQWGQYQEQIFARKGANDWDLGLDRNENEFGNYDMMFPRRLRIRGRKGDPDLNERRFWFPADPAMLTVAHRVAQTVTLSRRTANGDTLNHTPRVFVGGNGVSGPTFVDNAEYRAWVWKTFQANALDMETAAVAHVAYVNKTPYIAFRSLSDLAGGSDGDNELPVFFQLAADNSAKVVLAFLEAWGR